MADVSHILALKSKRKSVTVQREIPIDLDVGLLAAFDPNPIDDLNTTGREEYLKESARDSIQVLVNKLFGLTTTLTDEGVVANLPGHDKGIAPKPQRDRMEFDESKQEWVNRWGFNGKNKDEESAWIREIKPSEELTNPGLEINHAKRARKERTLKNEKQRLKNVERAATEIAKSSATKILEASSANLTQIRPESAKIAENTERTKAKLRINVINRQAELEVEGLLLATKKSTASLGKFDKKFTNEPKVKGLKRKFEPTEQSAKKSSKSTTSSSTTEPDKGTKALVNTRKAIRTLTGGRGATALETKPLKKSKKRLDYLFIFGSAREIFYDHFVFFPSTPFFYFNLLFR
ncbi:hypothetical protein H4Q26_002473 [Puccinia striiformis f. sp. tritici PST-130]|nr:hypothetical protein H4Q26_002473 [Puccinia striiformis f. sp. tritici PST-130]